MNASVTSVSSTLQLPWRRRVPHIMQAQHSECGIACLAMVASFYGLKVDLHRLRGAGLVSEQGANLKQLTEYAAMLSLNSRAVKLEPEHLGEVKLPAILHWDMQHFVVLSRVSKREITINDPAIGERKLSWGEFNQHFTGIALELQPANTFEKADVRSKVSLAGLWAHITGLKRSLCLMFGLSLLLQCFALASPYYMQMIIDDVILNQDTQLLNVLFVGFLLLLAVETLTNFIRQNVGLHLTSHLAQQLSVNVFTHLLKLPFSYFASRHIGDLVTRFGALHEIRRFISEGIVSLVLDSLIVLCTLVLMAIYSVKLMLIVLGFSVLFTLLRMVIFRPLQVLQQEKQVCDGKESTHFIETVRGIQSVRMLRLEGFRLQGWQHLLTDCLNRDIRIKRWDMGFNAAQLFLFGLENLLVVYFAAQLVLVQALSVGMLYAFISYKGRFNNAINTLVSQLIQWRLLRVHLEHLADIVHTPAKLESLSTASPQNNSLAPAHKVELRDFSFAYTGGHPVLKGLSLTIHPGELVVITGHSGNGKSTLVKCLTGLYEATSGQLLIDNFPLDNRHPQQRISAVMQDDICLSGTLIENICGFQADIDMSRLVQCCQLACLHTTIMQLPMQYFSLLHEGGSNLSGGQRQRLYLARALYQNPALLILDEASSHLDIECEKAINTNLARLSMTRIVIAHRQETIAMAQRRFHLQDGCLTEVPVSFRADLPPKPSQGEHYA